MNVRNTRKEVFVMRFSMLAAGFAAALVLVPVHAEAGLFHRHPVARGTTTAARGVAHGAGEAGRGIARGGERAGRGIGHGFRCLVSLGHRC
jgi:hypothetical protein